MSPKMKTPKKKSTRYRTSRKGIGGRKPVQVDEEILMSEVCHHFIRGLSVTQILDEVNRHWGRRAKMNRETPYDLVRKAGQRGYIKYDPPVHETLQQKLRTEQSAWLKDVWVVNTTVSSDVARKTADMLLGLVKKLCAGGKRNDIHIGFASGYSMRQVAKAFAESLSVPSSRLPERITFHAMVTGHDPSDPSTDSNAFFTFFTNRPVLQVKPRFIGLHAPAIVKDSTIELLRENEEVDAAYKAARKLDFIVTSGTDWADNHSALQRCMRRYPELLDKLKAAGAIGDLLWRPIGEKGPLEQHREMRAMTLVELSELPALIAGDTQVVLMLAPCGKCHRTKGRLLKTVIEQEPHLIDHLVVDSLSVAEYYELLEEN